MACAQENRRCLRCTLVFDYVPTGKPCFVQKIECPLPSARWNTDQETDFTRMPAYSSHGELRTAGIRRTNDSDSTEPKDRMRLIRFL